MEKQVQTFNGQKLKRLILLKAQARKVKPNKIRTEIRKRLGVTKQCLSLWEAGRGMPAINNLAWLKDFFKVNSMDEFLNE